MSKPRSGSGEKKEYKTIKTSPAEKNFLDALSQVQQTLTKCKSALDKLKKLEQGGYESKLARPPYSTKFSQRAEKAFALQDATAQINQMQPKEIFNQLNQLMIAADQYAESIIERMPSDKINRDKEHYVKLIQDTQNQDAKIQDEKIKFDWTLTTEQLHQKTKIDQNKIVIIKIQMALAQIKEDFSAISSQLNSLNSEIFENGKGFNKFKTERTKEFKNFAQLKLLPEINFIKFPPLLDIRKLDSSAEIKPESKSPS